MATREAYAQEAIKRGLINTDPYADEARRRGLINNELLDYEVNGRLDRGDNIAAAKPYRGFWDRAIQTYKEWRNADQNIVDIVARESSRKIELDEPLTKISVELKEKEAEKSPEKVSAKKSSSLDILTKNKLSFGLIAGIIILLILIMIVLVNRR